MAENIRVEVLNSRQVRRRLLDLEANLGRITGDADGDIRDFLVNSQRNRFKTKTAPDGSPWAPLSQVQIRRSNSNFSQVLVDTGDLRDSVGVVESRNQFSLRRNTGAGFRIGVLGDRAKALTHQFGGRSPLTGGAIPARPFLGINTADLQGVANILERKLRFA